ncbi:cannabinoid receptor 2-like [Ciona intestinalis]
MSIQSMQDVLNQSGYTLGRIYAADDVSATSQIHQVVNQSASNMENITFIGSDPRSISPVEIATSIASILAIFVNFCVLLVIYIGPRAFRTPTFFFISSLATADLLTGITILLAIFLPVSDHSWERLVLKGLAVVCFSASVNNLMVIAGDRYLKINDDRRYGTVFTNRSAAILIVLTWICAISLFLVAPLVGWSCGDDFCTCPRDAMCVCDNNYCSQSFTPFSKSYLIVGVSYFVVSLIAMVGLYWAIFASVRRRAGSKRHRNGSVVGPVASRGPFVMIHRRREIRLAKTLVIVMGVFFICWLPVVTLFVYDVIVDDKRLIVWFDYCLASAVIHPLANPIIYSLRLPRMWCTFKYLAYAVWRRLVMKSSPPRPHPGKLYRCSSSSVRRQGSGAASLSSQYSIRHRADKARRAPNLSVATQISNTGPERTSSDGSDVFLHGSEPRVCSTVHRSSSAKVVTKRDDVEPPAKRSLTLCGREAKKREGFGWDYRRDRSKRGSSKTVLLSDGSVVPRDSVSISPPLQPEYKLAWN